MLTLQTLLDGFASGGADAIRPLLADVKDLKPLQAEAKGVFSNLYAAADRTIEDVESMSVVADVLEVIDAEQGARDALIAAAAAQAEELAARVLTASDDETSEAETPEAEAVVADAVAEETPVVEAEAVVAEAAAEVATETTVASVVPRRRVDLASIVERTPPPAAASIAEKTSGITIVASSDIPGVPSSSELTKDELSLAMHAKARNLSDGRGRREKHLIASISAPAQHDVTDVLDDEGIRAAWDKAHSVEDMVASGGWCAPSETIYDFACDFEAMPEEIDLPTLTSRRGGLRYPISPLLGDVLNDPDSGFTWTEADDIAAASPAGPTKACFTIPCPTFDEERLQAQGICVTAGNLTDRAYPELTNRYIDLVMTAHAHRMNLLKINRLVAASTAVAPTVADLSAAEAVLASIELQIAVLRDQFFMAEGQVLEVVLPRWVRTVIRRDLARRSGVAFDQVSNADIQRFFTEIGARVQFVSDWQRIAGAVGSVVTLPATVQALVYPAGAHTLLDGGSLDLGVVRDSTLNATNDYTAAWTEVFWTTVSRCVSLVVTIALCADGSTGAPATIVCPTA